MTHILDRPVWNALLTAHADLAEGGPLARRYPPSIVPFAASADNSSESLEALENLPTSDQAMAIVQADPIIVSPNMETVLEGTLVQMIADRTFERIADPRIQPLTEAAAAEMLALADLTKPGPFTLGAQKLGTFWGVKIDGQLVVMAGQRMRQPGFAELSGLCTHPEFQGRGLGTLLFRYVAGEIAARGETPYLHAYISNTGAIGLYKTLGFTLRSEMNLRVVKRRG